MRCIMLIAEAIKILENYNQWRRGADIPQPNPKLIGIAIDKAIKELKPLAIIRNLTDKNKNYE